MTFLVVLITLIMKETVTSSQSNSSLKVDCQRLKYSVQIWSSRYDDDVHVTKLSLLWKLFFENNYCFVAHFRYFNAPLHDLLDLSGKHLWL